MFETQIITSYKQFKLIKDEWNELVSNSEHDHVFFTHEWFDCWWQAFGFKQQLYIIILKEQDKPVAIAPFMLNKKTIRGLPVKIVQFMANDDSPRCDIITKKYFIKVEKVFILIADLLLSSKPKWTLVLLENIERDSATIKSFKKIFKERNIKYTCDSKLFSPWIAINIDWEAFYGSLKRQAKKKVNNVRNRIQKLGKVQIKQFGDAEKMREMSVISKKAWKYKEGKSYLNRDDRRMFFERFSRMAQEQGRLSIWILYISGRPVAYEYHLRYDHKEIALLAEFDQDYSACSPGAFLDYTIVKQLFESGIKEYDLGGSLDQYKKKWKPNIRYTEDYYIYNASFLSLLLYFIETRVIYSLKIMRNKISGSAVVNNFFKAKQEGKKECGIILKV